MKGTSNTTYSKPRLYIDDYAMCSVGDDESTRPEHYDHSFPFGCCERSTIDAAIAQS